MKKILAVLLAVMLLFTGCSLPVINLTDYASSPESDFAAFLDQLCAGNYSKASEYVYNYSSLGFESFEDEAYQHLLECLNNSRSFTVMGSSSVHGKSAVMNIDFTTLDYSKLSDALSDATLAKVNEVQYNTGVLPEDGEIESIMAETLDILMQDPAEYSTTKNFSLDFVYESDMWKFVCTDDFYSALVGYIV